MTKFIAAFILQFIDPKKPLGKKLFNALARLAVTPTIETVALREHNGEVEVFLTQRSMTDASYPGFWHLPGTAIRPGETLKASLGRMAKTECGVDITKYEVVGLINNLKEPRGHFISSITLITFSKDPNIGKWVNINSLDITVIDFHKNLIIPIAVKYFISTSKTPSPFVENI